MSSFFRSNKSASSSSTDLAKAGPETSEIYTTPLDGVKPSKKWEYDENQIKQVSHDSSGGVLENSSLLGLALAECDVDADASLPRSTSSKRSVESYWTTDRG
jgi:hypothetical protein